jgi:hypothetical protein
MIIPYFTTLEGMLYANVHSFPITSCHHRSSRGYDCHSSYWQYSHRSTTCPTIEKTSSLADDSETVRSNVRVTAKTG